MGELEVSRYDAGSKAEVVDLLRVLVSDEHTTRRYLEWKYEENPILREPALFLVRDEGRLVGMRGLLGTRWEAGTDRAPVVIPHPDDHVVVESHRKSGVAGLLMRAVLEDAAARGYPFLCNLSAGLTTAVTSLAAGWKRVKAMDQVERLSTAGPLWRTLSPLVAQSEKLKGLSHSRGWMPSALAGFKRLDATGEGHGARTGSRIVVRASPPSAAMAALVEALGHDGRIRHVRDVAWLDWRYRHPVHDYRFLCHESGGTMDGYLVVTRYLDGRFMGRAQLVDWEAADEAVAAALLDSVVRWAEFPVLSAWNATLTPARRRLLEERGFVPAEPERRKRGIPSLLVTAPGKSDGNGWMLNGCPMLEQDQWDLRMIYSMQG